MPFINVFCAATLPKSLRAGYVKGAARADEIGVPYCITIDFDTLVDGAVTIRDRYTTKQERVPISDIVHKLVLLAR